MLRKLLQILFLLGAVSPAGAADPIEGVHYQTMPPAAQGAAPAVNPPVTVVYHLSHYCATCAQIAAPVDRWLAALPPDVVQLKVIVRTTGDEPNNESYQVLRQLGVLPRIEPKLFSQLTRPGQNLKDRQALLAWLGKHGVSAEAFEKAAKSFTVGTQTARARAALRRVMELESAGVPGFVIDDRYWVSLGAASQIEKNLATATALVAKSRAERARSQ